MAEFNIMDYIKWRGDLSFLQDSFNLIDSLILTQIAYIPFEGIVPSQKSLRTITMEQAAKQYFAKGEKGTPTLGVLIPKQIIDLFRIAAQSNRFGKLRLGSYVNKIETDDELQFSAMTVLLDEVKEMYIAFRGTDDTLVGWKEDFNMSYMDTVPAQVEAVSYLEFVVDKYITQGNGFESICMGGHSKGGNLAVYSGAYANSVQGMIREIHNFDGPGFNDSILESEEYGGIRNKIRTIVPQGSIVGLLLGHKEEYTVVESRQFGIMQHDAMTWSVLGREFVYVDKVTNNSEIFDHTVKDWIGGMEPEEAEKFISTIYDILSATDAKTLTELMSGKNKSFFAAVKAYAGENEENKKMIRDVLHSVYNSWRKNITKPKKNDN